MMVKRCDGACHNRGARATGQALLALAALAGATVQAQAPAARPANTAVQAAQPPVFAIRGFQVLGDNPLGEGETARVLAPFLRSNATIETLQQATAALETALRERGWGLYRVALPPQEVGNTVTLNIVRFTVGTIAIEGRSIYDEANVRLALPELREGSTPNFKRMAVQAAIANENPNKQIQLGLRESQEADRVDATLTVKEARPWNLGLVASNAGTASSGRDRLTLSGGHSNLFNRDHQFTGAYTTSVERGGDVQQYGLSYRVPLYAAGGVLGASYTRSTVIGSFGAFTSTGAGHTVGVNYTLYLPPEGGRRSYFTFALDDKVFDAARINNFVVPGALDRRSRALSLSYTARVESNTSAWGYSAEFITNLGGGEGNSLTAYQSEDPRIDTTRWKALRASVNYAAPLAKTWQLGLRAQAQWSPDVLIAGEQFGLGGLSSVRGTRLERPVTGDKGLSGTVELSTPELVPGLRLLGFVDAGRAFNNSPNGTSRLSSDALASTGLGLRYGGGRVSVSADYGRLIRGSQVSSAFNSGAARAGDDRFYLSLGLKF